MANVKTDKCLTEHHKIGRYEVDFTIGMNGCVAEWEPELTPHCLEQDEVDIYKKHRNRLVERFCEETGHRILIVDY